jgi:hypothetical protein
MIVTVLVFISLVDTKVESQSVVASQDSKVAYYAADSGVAEALLRINFQNRTETKSVNGANVPIWIPWDLRTGGTDTDPTTWTFVQDDGIDNGAGSTSPCGGTGASDCSGFDATADDWAEMYPNWQADIWDASQSWVDSNVSNLPSGAQHYATLFDFTSRMPFAEFGIIADPGATDAVATSRGGIFIKRKLDSAGKIIFTDGMKQFTAVEAMTPVADGGIGMTPPPPGGVPPAWPVFEIWSTGRHNSSSRRLVAEVANFPNKLPDTALYVCGDLSSPPTITAGGAFLVSGYDYAMYDSTGKLIVPATGNSTKNTLVKDPSQPATAPVIATTVCCHKGPGNCTDPGDETAAVNAQITGGEYFGLDSGDGDTFQLGELDVQALFDSFVPFISPTGCGASGCDVTGVGLKAMGTDTSFVVARVTGTVGKTLSNPLPNSGFGVLLLDIPAGSSIKLTSNVRLWGLVVVVGEGDLESNGTLDVIGAMYVGADINMKGNYKLLFSRDALSRIPRIMQARILRLFESAL